MRGFHAGDDATVWGLTPNDFKIATGNNVRLSHPASRAITAAGKPNANLTLAGCLEPAIRDVAYCRSLNALPDLTGLPGSNYMLIHGN